ncbi:glycosyl hydrolase family 18 protein [Pedobacter namyangjuensis]|uniref:glycosyl hydrolase family 18 protein n=1 Tax=Pedobacter namyangjuensis TaxID=600626 RepID=UPI000DE40A83|nr:glycosyl hydrolase family 18 protein [Pedobacter namyangjuensis]
MRFPKLITFICLFVALIFLSCAKKTDVMLVEQVAKIPLPPAIPMAPKFHVIAYVPEWSIDMNSIQFDKLTHINYAFILPTVKGDLSPIGDVSALKQLIAKAHSNKVKVLASIGGWNHGDASAFISLSANESYRKNFISQILRLFETYSFDGVDIDWETPKLGVSDKNFTALIKELSTAVHNEKKIITIAVPPLNEPGIENEVLTHIDFLNIMAYDSFSNLLNHSPYSLVVDGLAYWKGRGLPSSKAILGVPFYGRARKDWDFTSYVLYKDILQKGGSATSDTFNGIGYNGIQTIKKKTEYALKEAGGVMIWELSADVAGSNSLLNALNEVVTSNTDKN